MGTTKYFNRQAHKGEFRTLENLSQVYVNRAKQPTVGPYKSDLKFKGIITFVQHLQHFKPHHKISSCKPLSAVCSDISIIRGSYEIHLVITGKKVKCIRIPQTKTGLTVIPHHQFNSFFLPKILCPSPYHPLESTKKGKQQP